MGLLRCLPFIFIGYCGSALHGQTTYTWQATTPCAGNNWSTGTNWSSAGTPPPDATDAIAVFSTFTNQCSTVNVDTVTTWTVGTLQFTSATAYTLTAGGATLEFSVSSGTGSITTTAGSHSIAAPLALASNLSISQSTAGTLTLSGVISNSGTFAGALSVAGQPTSVTVLSVANTYTGGTSISSGILQIAADSGLGDAAGTVAMSGGTLQVTGAVISSSRNFTLTGSPTIDTQANTLTLSGTISGTGSLTKAASGAVSGGTLVLSGTNTYSGGTTVSTGTLRISADANLGASAGALSLAGGTTLNTITNSFTSARAVTLSGGTTPNTTFNISAATTFTLSGNITGAGGLTLSTGTGTLILSGTNSYSGGTVVSSGILRGTTTSLQGNITDNAILTFLQSTSGTYAGQISGGGAAVELRIDGGGVVQMTGNSSSFTGATHIMNGSQLTMDGNLQSSAVTIESSSTLRGVGTVGNTHVGTGAARGTLSPGNTSNPTGTLTVNGTLDFGAFGGSSLLINIAPGAVNSRVAATGVATLTNGTLSVTPLSGFYGLTSTYTLLTATGGLGGTTFTSFSVTNPNFVGTLSYLPTSVQLRIDVLRPFLGFPFANDNERAVGNNIDDLNAAGLLSSDLISIINALVGQSNSVINQALDQMHPAAMSAMAELQFELGGQLLSLLHRTPTLLCSCHQRNRIWAEPFGNWYDRKEKGEEIGFDATTRGIACGYDHQFFDAWTVGFAGAWNETDLTWQFDRGYAYTEGLYGAAYTDLILGNYYFGGSIYAGRDWYDAMRHIQFTTIDRQAATHYHGLDAAAQITAAYFFGSPACLLYPYGTIDFLYLDNTAYSEHGANGLDLDVEGYTSSTIRSEAGLALQFIDKNYRETVCISPFLSLGWVLEWPLSRDHYTAHFVGEPLSFKVTGWNQTWQLLNIRFGLGITYKCFTLDSYYFADISPEGGDPFTNQRANFRFSYHF